MMNGMGMAGMMICGVLALVLGLLLIALLVVAAIGAVRWLRRRNALFLMRERESALGILKKRYVRGEIGKDEYEKTKADIQ